MRRPAFGLATFAAAMLVMAPPAWAQDSISVSATLTGNTVVVEATGSAPDCTGIIYCTVDVVVGSSSNGTQCSQDLSPQGSTAITSSGGSFAFTFNVPESTGDQYVVCGYVASGGSTNASSQPALVTIAAISCRPGTPHALYINAPSDVAYGRTASVDVGDNDISQTVGGGVLAARQLSASTPFYSYRFTSFDTNNFNNNAADEFFNITLPRSGGPTQVAVSYLEDESDYGPPQCIDERSVVVRPVAGKTPTVKLSTYGGTVSFSAPGGCNVTRVISAEVDVRGSGADSELRSKDVCRLGSWRVSGRTPGVSTRTGVDDSGSTVTFRLVGHINRGYQMVVRVGGRVVKYVLMATVYQHTPTTRVYQGTDAFVNYCIDQSHTIYSYNHVLFCRRPGSTTQYIILTS
jgi:hypothetical protein